MTQALAVPASVVSDGMVKVMAVLVMGDPSMPGLHEVNAGSALDISCYLTDTGWAPAVTEDVATDNRLCSRQNFQRPGRSATQVPLSYVYNIFDPSEDAARLLLVNRLELFLVARWGKDFDDPFITGDIVDVYPVQLGTQMKQPAAANVPLTINQIGYVIAPGVQYDVLVTAS